MKDFNKLIEEAYVEMNEMNEANKFSDLLMYQDELDVSNSTIMDVMKKYLHDAKKNYEFNNNMSFSYMEGRKGKLDVDGFLEDEANRALDAIAKKSIPRIEKGLEKLVKVWLK